MSDQSFALTDMFRAGLPDPAPRFDGLPKYNFVYGHNDPSQVPAEALAEAAATVLRDNGRLLGMYNLGQAPQGHDRLRAFIAAKLARRSGITCSADDVLVTSGSLQAMDLVNNLLVAAGDTVILEEFTYGGAISKVQKLGARVIGAPLHDGGIRIDALRTILEDLKRQGVRPKYIYTIPTVQNPTGSILDLDRRHQLIALAREFGVPIFEDECYADLVWAGARPPALYALDPSRVIHIGSFSKSLAPALRVGYIVADWQVLSRILATKTDAGSGALEQMVVAEYVERNFDRHVSVLTGALRGKLDVLVDALGQEFGTSAELFVPQGGIFLWLRLPDHVDVRRFAQAALAGGLAFNPGPDWACDGEAAKSHIRLCFALPTVETIRQGVAELARVCFEHTGVPEHGVNRRRG
ncbi:PLP-dependent aminotransferase family protein [Phreatobacter stygius]|uniref:PLP-dependent aminotransferase family protein n=1 Tax=Phreatobacter stygius TaxID=1940610 RepID=A0A4D7B347_9HYPH|nr:PLP-dependent aminotransferase family protein [Phreatobacter stygius]QCI64006.1 PLP-dependent aminotransferase family protein [Phreatobacter stygius]